MGRGLGIRGACAAIATIAVTAAATATALADGPTTTASLTPNTPGAASKLSFTATGPFPGVSGSPTGAMVTLQPGFSSSLKATTALCTAAEATANTCPAASEIGTGTAVATGTLAIGTQIQDTVTLTMFLAAPTQPGDISSVVIKGRDSVLGVNLAATGRVFKSAGVLELVIADLPALSYPGVTITLDSLSLSAGAKHVVTKTIKVRTGTGRHRRTRKKTVKTTYSLLTNPAACPAGQWTGSYTITFASGSPITGALSLPCSAH